LQGILLDNTYYRALAQPNVDVATNSIKEVGENYVVTDDGTKHEVDTLILGTGFAASGFLAPIEIRGRAGRELSAAWRDGAEAYRFFKRRAVPPRWSIHHWLSGEPSQYHRTPRTAHGRQRIRS
jgi:cation diffusion facilitator CzcD-associated flavoprotein CzcO